MAFSAIKLCSLLAITVSFVLADAQSYESPFVGLVRLKRSAAPHHAYTFTGFNPTNGLAAFASSAYHVPQFQIPAAAIPQAASPSMQRRSDTVAPDSPPSVEYQPPSSDYPVPSAEYAPSTSGELQQNVIPSNEVAPNSPSDNSPAAITQQSETKTASAVPATTTEGEKEEVGNRKTKENSNSSFNAWFPIILGTFPSAAQRGQNYDGSESSKDAVSAPLNGPRGPAGGLGRTVIANSVSSGKGSVASSHAIAYGGAAPQAPQAPEFELLRKI